MREPLEVPAGETDPTASSALIAWSNALVSEVRSWQVPLSQSTSTLDQWHPGPPVRAALVIEARLGTDKAWLLLDEAARRHWFRGVLWRQMSQAVRARYLEHRSQFLLDALGQIFQLPVAVLAVHEAPARAAAGPEPLQAGLNFRLRQRAVRQQPTTHARRTRDPQADALPAGSLEAKFSLILEPPPAAATALRWARALAAFTTNPAQTPFPSPSSRAVHGADPAPGQGQNRTAAQRPASRFDFDLLVGTVRLSAEQLGSLQAGALLMVPRPSGNATAERSPLAADALALQLVLGRTPVLQAVLANGRLQFLSPLPSRPLAGVAGKPIMTADIKQLEFDVTLRFGRLRMTLAQLEAIQPGQTLAANETEAEPEIDLLVDGRAVGTGKLVRVGANWAISITRWGADGN